MDDLAGRVAVVTGAGSGIGRGIAHALAAAGARVAVTDVEEAAAETVAGELTDAGGHARAYRLDVTDAVAVEALTDVIEGDLGPVSILCNNAGVMVDGPLVESPVGDWQWVFDVNVHGSMHGIRAFVPRIRAHGQGGHVVNTGSMAGVGPRTEGTLGTYSASKAAVVVIGEMLREELAPDDIGVTVLCPGPVRTNFWASYRNRPETYGPGADIPLPDRIEQASDPMAVGERVVDAIRTNRAYVFTSDDAVPRIEARFNRLLADAQDR